MYHSYNSGWIEVICGSMFSGKTEELIRRLRRAEYAKQNVQVFKPTLDNRYSINNVSSHAGRHFSAQEVETANDIAALLEDNTSVIGIDEVQFFGWEIVELCNWLANTGRRVLVAGLDMDFKGNPFGPMPQLMAIAEYVTKVHAVCIQCGNAANYSHRTVTEEKLVMLGETDTYEPLCRKCYIESRK